jgi:regulatory protein
MPNRKSPILDNIKKYCAYSERCIYDVKKKLKTWKVEEHVINNIINELLRQGYINEERYAKVYAVSKLRNNKWGIKKIIYNLQQKQIPDLYIQIGISAIDQHEYVNILKALLSSKKVDANDEWIRKNKLVKFGVQKGFQADLCWKIINGEL